MDYEKLAETHTNIWWAHDQKKFDSLQKNAEEFLLLLGFEPKKTIAAAAKIKQAYLSYDATIEEINETKKKDNFKKMNLFHKQVMKILDFPQKNGENYSEWWVSFSKRDYPKITLSLLKYHFGFFKSWRVLFAPIIVLILVLAGYLGHNKRKKKTTKTFLKWYWWLTLKIVKNKFIIY